MARKKEGEEKRTSKTIVCWTESELVEVRKRAEACGETLSMYIRRCCLEADVYTGPVGKVEVSPEVKELLKPGLARAVRGEMAGQAAVRTKPSREPQVRGRGPESAEEIMARLFKR